MATSDFSLWSTDGVALHHIDLRNPPKYPSKKTHHEEPRTRRQKSPSPVKKANISPHSGVYTYLNTNMEVDNDLQCPICLELFSYPIILPCSHVLCRSPCAEHLFDFNFIRCPVCRDNCYVSGGINSLPRVIALENIVERYKAEKQERETPVNNTEKSIEVSGPIHCQVCEKSPKRKAKKSCLDCNVSYCSSCLRTSHPNRSPFNSHELVSPQKLNANQNASSVSGSKGLCGTHKDQVVSFYCQNCLLMCCGICKDMKTHCGHHIITIQEAYLSIKNAIEDNAKKLKTSQEKVMTKLKTQRDNLKDMQQVINRRRDHINSQCDALLAEIENKRNYFLSDLEYEERIQQNDMEDLIKVMDKIQGAAQALLGYTSDVVKEDKSEFLQVASSLNDKLIKTTLDCESASFHPVDVNILQEKIVDFRQEKALLRNLQYLTAPSTPVIDVTRCSRSEDTVVLVLSPPSGVHDLIDQYEIHYCSEEQKRLEIEDTVVVKNVTEDKSARGFPSGNGLVVILIENLCKATTYYFCVSALNAVGKSSNSEVVQCTTLLPGESIVAVPVIVESLCRQFTSSIQVYSSSPQEVAAEQQICHFLLYRSASTNRAWKTMSLYGRQDHRVFGLELGCEYEFVILACNHRGECQISNKVTLQTDDVQT